METIDSPRTTPVEPAHAVTVSSETAAPRVRQASSGGTFAALRHRNFRLFLGGQLVAMAGTWMQNVAQGWLVYEISGSELALGVVGFAAAIPALMISPWAGVIVDRVSKRELLLMTQTSAMVLAFVLAALAFADIVQVWHVLVLAVGLGAVNAFDGPARQAFVVEMVGREDLPNAIALNSMTFNTGRIVGPALGGIVLAAAGAAWCFFLNGLTFLAVLAGLSAMRFPPVVRKVEQRSPWVQMTSGLRYVRYSPDLRALLLLALVFSLFGISYSTVLPAYVHKVLNQGAGAFGVLNAATGVGAVTAAYWIARSGDHGHRGQWLTRSILGFPVALTLFALNPYYPVALVLVFLMGIGFMVTFNMLNTLLQTQVADEMRGRVMSLYTLTFFGFAPFGNLFVGTMSEWIGLSPAIILSAAICLIGVSAILVTTPSVRRLP